MNLDLAGNSALVTGSSAGIGKAIARSLAAEGARVIIHGRNRERAERIANDITMKAGGAEVVVGDLSTDAEAAIVTASALSGGPVDILVNNAGSYEPATWDNVTPEQWVRLYESDVVSAVRTTQAVMPGMRNRGWGRIIFIGSGSGRHAPGAAGEPGGTTGVVRENRPGSGKSQRTQLGEPSSLRTPVVAGRRTDATAGFRGEEILRTKPDELGDCDVRG